jgi:hypothetical protein
MSETQNQDSKKKTPYMTEFRNPTPAEEKEDSKWRERIKLRQAANPKVANPKVAAQ